VFLAHWCPHCNREIPELNAWRDSGEVPADLQVVAVTTAVEPFIALRTAPPAGHVHALVRTPDLRLPLGPRQIAS